MFYHIRITEKSNKHHDETKVDLTEEQLRTRFVEPYEKGEPIIINGKTVNMKDLERIQISRSELNFNSMKPALEYEDMQSSVVVIGGASYEWRAADRAEDVTDQFIFGPSGSKPSSTKNAPAKSDKSRKKIFVVHGHDHALKADLEVFLREIKLDPIVLHRQPDEGLTVIEKFEKNAEVSFAFILLTPDDIGFTSGHIGKPEAERGYEARARQNVIFEFGYFVARLGRSNVCCIYKEGVVLPSDVGGYLYKKVSNSISEIGYELIRELKNSGIQPEI